MTSLNRRRDGAREVVYLARPGVNPTGHECATQRALAAALAELKGWPFGGDYDPERHCAARAYFVPGDTLEAGAAARLGVHGEHDLFGGVVPFPFVATKTISHPLVHLGAQAPLGWSHGFGQRVRSVVLPGYSAFVLDDARAAGRRLLECGSVRIKLGGGVGGVGQSVARTAVELEDVLASIEAGPGFGPGVVLETNLEQVDTLSAGRTRIDDLVMSYYGRQRLTTDNIGRHVYGGSELFVVRGEFDVLRARVLPDEVRIALEQAQHYHAAALESFPGLCASRCNYDIAQGRDDEGNWLSGVLEQSWRIGGASGAELLAFAAFLGDPALQAVRATTIEVYGEAPPVPEDAQVLFSGVDPKVGRITKYARIEGYGDAG
ncbi:MAG TPA: DUF3182 family protein [Noviherbaspirillum sp.]|nr:DUF3182 family protein [Noviherbaspirillum sp.]